MGRDREIDRYAFRPKGPVESDGGQFVLYVDHLRIVRELERELGRPRVIDGPVDVVCPLDGAVVRLDALRCVYSRSGCVEDCPFRSNEDGRRTRSVLRKVRECQKRD